MAKKKKESDPEIEGEGEGEIESVEPIVLEWLVLKFPEFQGDNFLLELINNKFKDYLSILGVKQSKRQCTPLKLNRYIKVLNYLHLEGGMRESTLRALIVKDEALFNVGIMHKRSLMGILEGLKNLGIIFEDDSFYYPGWVKEELWEKKSEPMRRMKEDLEEEPPRKKVHIDTTTKLARKAEIPKREGKSNGLQKDEFKKITERKYKCELFTAVLTIGLQKAINQSFRKAFHRIIYVERRKNVQQYVPALNALNLLEAHSQPQQILPELNFDSGLEAFYRELDLMVEERGEQEQPIPEVEN